MPRTVRKKSRVRRFALRSSFPSLAVRLVLVGTLIGGSSALRFKGAQEEGVLDRNGRVIVKQTGWPNFIV
jgi:hypothetical protein